MSRPRDDEPSDEVIDALVAKALVKKGELLPTTVGEVREAEESSVEFEGELPASLRALGDPPAEAPASRAAAEPSGPAMSERVVSLDTLRKKRERAGTSAWSHVGTFVAGLAVAAGVAFVLRTPPRDPALPEPGAGPIPAASTSAAPEARPVVIPAVRACEGSCCAGSACPDAKGELTKCASGRTCIGCDPPAGDAAFSVRLASFIPTEVLGGASLDGFDLCGRVLGGDWTCVPAHAEPATKPAARSLARLVSIADLATGLEVELRPRGTKSVLGRWRDSVRLGPTVLCRGLGALVTNEKGENVGSLAVTLDDPYHVEIARAADVAELKARRALLQLADVEPAVVETSAAGARRFALTAGPFDRKTAEKLRWALLAEKQEAVTVLGEDYTGEPLVLP
jgi:hypothetical protein